MHHLSMVVVALARLRGNMECVCSSVGQGHCLTQNIPQSWEMWTETAVPHWRSWYRRSISELSVKKLDDLLESDACWLLGALICQLDLLISQNFKNLMISWFSVFWPLSVIFLVCVNLCKSEIASVTILFIVYVTCCPVALLALVCSRKKELWELGCLFLFSFCQCFINVRACVLLWFVYIMMLRKWSCDHMEHQLVIWRMLMPQWTVIKEPSALLLKSHLHGLEWPKGLPNWLSLLHWRKGSLHRLRMTTAMIVRIARMMTHQMIYQMILMVSPEVNLLHDVTQFSLSQECVVSNRCGGEMMTKVVSRPLIFWCWLSSDLHHTDSRSPVFYAEIHSFEHCFSSPKFCKCMDSWMMLRLDFLYGCGMVRV